MDWYSLKEYRDSTLDGNSKPLVTIGICVRNSEDTIGAVIESILSQDFSHELMELIIVDDGSQDATLKVIYSFFSKMNFRIKLFSGSWRGLGPARQTVVENTRGKYIAWVDSDTILSKDYIRTQVEFMENNPKIGIIKGKCRSYRHLSSQNNNNLVAFLEEMSFLAAEVKYGGLTTQKLPGTSGSTYRLKAIKQVGGFDIRITGAGEDMDAAFRISKRGWLIYFSTGGIFFHKYKDTWINLWKQYFWHGFGFHYVYHKDKNIGNPWDMLPFSGFLSGLLYSLIVYKLAYRKVVFLLPIHFIFKNTAWYHGFLKSHLGSIGHEKN